MNQLSVTPTEKVIADAYRARRARWAARAYRGAREAHPACKDVWRWTPEREPIDDNDHVEAWKVWKAGDPRLTKARMWVATRAAEIGSSYREIMSGSKDKPIVAMRHRLIWEFHKFYRPDLGWKDLGRAFRINHSTAVHAFWKIEARETGSDEAMAHLRARRQSDNACRAKLMAKRRAEQ